MDKSKNRSDLLAAGRKKLQQFRQKKDGKGSTSHGKSLKRHSKSEQPEADIDAKAVASQSMASVNAVEVDADQPPPDSVVDSAVVSLPPESEAQVASTAVAAAPDSISVSLGEGELSTVAESPAINHELAKVAKSPAIDDESKRIAESPEIDGESWTGAELPAINSESKTVFESPAIEGDSVTLTEPPAVDGGTPTAAELSAVDGESTAVGEPSVVDGESTTVAKLPAYNGESMTVVELPMSAGESIVVAASLGFTRESTIAAQVPAVDPNGDKPEAVSGGVDGLGADISTMSEGQNAGIVLAEDASPSASGFVNACQEMAALGSLDTMNREEDKDPLVSTEQVLDGMLIQQGGAQVTDEADGLGSDHIDRSAMLELQGDRPGFTSDIANAVELIEANLSEQAISGEYSSLKDEGADVVMKGRNADVDPGLPDFSLQPLLFDDISREDPLDTKTRSQSELTVASSTNTSSVGLPHLIEVIKGLSTDDFGLLLEARGLVSGAGLERNGKSPVQESISQGVLERLEDDLFLSNLTNEIFYLQLKEHMELLMKHKHQQNLFIDEISRLNSSLAVVCAKNESLREELLQCRCELQAAVGGQEELQDQVHTAKAEIEALLARLHELQTSLEISTKNLASQTQELAGSKGSVEALKLQNEELDLAVVSLTAERKKIEESKEHAVHESETLATQLLESNMLVEGLRTEVLALTESLNMVTEVKGCLVHEVDGISSELAKSKGLVADLQSEVENLNRTLNMMAEDGKKTKEEKDLLVYEYDRLSEEFLLLKKQLSSKDEEHSLLEEELKEKVIHLEQLIQENLSLRSTLETCNKTTETQSFSGVQRNQLEALEVNGQVKEDGTDSGHITQKKGHDFSPLKEKGSLAFLDKGTSVELLENCSELFVLKGRTDDMLKILQKLEKAIEGIHSYKMSSNKSGDKVGAAGVSKLIHAFESKITIDEQEGGFLTSDLSLTDQCTLSRELMANLKALLKQLALDVENAAVLFKGQLEEGRTANFLVSNLKDHCESLKEDNDCLEGSSIQLKVFCEVLMQCMSDVKLKNSQLLMVNEALNQQDITRRRESNELSAKLQESESRVRDLEGQVQQLLQIFDEWASLVHSQLQSLLMEVTQRAVMLQLEQSVVISEIVETVEKLNSYIPVIPDHNKNGLDINAHVCASVFSAIRVIESLQEEVRDTQKDKEAIVTSCRMTQEKLSILQEKNESAITILHNLFSKLRRLVISSHLSQLEADKSIKDEVLCEPLDESNFNILVEELGNIMGERSKLESDLNQLQSELKDKTQCIQEMSINCIGIDSIRSLIDDVQTMVNLEGAEIDVNGQPCMLLQSLISFLVQKCREASEQLEMSRKAVTSKAMELTNAREALHESNSSHPEGEITVLRGSLCQAEEKLALLRTQLHEKSTELELSEQRVSSLREKLSIAVSKGKGLVVQRDTLKQSLAETSNELEKCSQELQMKDARLHEVETKLRTYSEAGERVEALESELSYIRNSATALRESFLLKDSLLQRVEEILEDLNLPEHFHEKDIIEKVHWLARSAAGNSSPPNEWDHKSSVGASYSDAGAIVTDAWREEVQPSLNSWDDLRRKYDDLQSKFYGLAEQNEMLEQSLMERNNLVQRWEELLGRINVPSHMRSAEPEEKIEWLGSTLLEVHGDKISLQEKIDKIESYCSLLTADLEESCGRVSSVEEDLQVLAQEKEQLSKRLESLRQEHEELSLKADKFESENEKLQLEAISLQDKLAGKIENDRNIQEVEMGIKRLQDIIGDVLLDSVSEDLYSRGSGIDVLEGLLRELIAKYIATIAEKSSVGDAAHVDVHGTTYASSAASRMSEESDVPVLKKELEETLSELMCVKEERDKFLEKNDSVVHEIEAFQQKIEELQGLLNLEEQKSASVRERLNVAVRKGKSLVQQRDSLKQAIEEINVEVDQLKFDINHKENVLKDYENKVRELSSHSKRVEALESELSLLRNRLTETEHFWQEKGHNLEIILSILAEINLGVEVSYTDPVDKLRLIGKLYVDNNAHMNYLEQESKKSKRAAELLLAELNEVQDRNDRLQEEIAQAEDELHKLYQEKDIAEAAKCEAIAHLEHTSALHSDERRKLFSELMMLKSAAELLKDVFHDFSSLLDDVLLKDQQTLQKLQTAIDSCFKQNDASVVLASISLSPHGSFFSNAEKKENIFSVDPVSDKFGDNSTTSVCDIVEHCLQEFHTGIGALKEDLHKHLVSWQEQTSSLSDVLSIVNGDLIAQKQLLEVLERENSHFKLTEKQKDMEIAALHRNLALLCEAISTSLMELETSKSIFGRNLSAENWKMKVDAHGKFSSGHQCQFSSEEFVTTVADNLLSSIKEFACIKAGTLHSNEKELKSTIANLQIQLQEKDIQKDKICTELVSQIKAAEAAASHYSSDLESSKDVIRGLEEQVKVMEGEHDLLKQRLNEVQDAQVLSADLQERLRSLTDLLASKDQEIEALMQALDEEEIQMEGLVKKTEGLEKVLQEKNLTIEEVEVARGKTLKKLSITVSKFDELHQFSASLLAEVEKLQAQLTERDADISFLRQEVTRCTNDALVASQVSNKTNSKELHDFLAWFDTMISGGVMDSPVDEKSGEVDEYKELLQKKIMSIVSEIENLRVAAQHKDTLLQLEKNKVDELKRKEEGLEKSLYEKESELSLLQGTMIAGQTTGSTSEIVEVEPVMNSWAMAATSTAPQVRSLRKANNDQVTIAVDVDPASSNRLDDEDDDKVHGFKSLTTSRIIPKFTRPVTDLVDGLWVSCDRALMRQPTLRLGIIMYWAVLHALLATFIV